TTGRLGFRYNGPTRRANKIMESQPFREGESVVAQHHESEPRGPKPVSFPTAHRTYVLGELFAEGDMADLYHCRYSDDGFPCDAICKIARDPADNDLLANEARQLKHLWSGAPAPSFHCFLPQLIESFPAAQEMGPPRWANVLNMPEGYY